MNGTPGPLFGPLNPPLAHWPGRRVWLVGGSTGIGAATAAVLHARGAEVFVSARGEAALAALATKLPGLRTHPLDVTNAAQCRRVAGELFAGGPMDLVVFGAARYEPVRATGYSLEEMLRHQAVNYVGALNLLDAVLPALLAQGRGHVSLVASVAGYRGLPRSLAYGPTKAALIQLAETLYLDLHSRGLGVSVVNPGFVRTPLTARNDFRMPALIEPADAAEAMLRGWARGAFEIHFPRRFTVPMKLLSMLPFRLYQAAVHRATGG